MRRLYNTTFSVLFLILVFSLLPAKQAHAYLDPGTGNVFVYVLVALLSTASFLLKSFFYKIKKIFKKETAVDANVIKADNNELDNIVIFSEGKQYWFTFKPIIEYFLENKVPFRYLSMDVEDPGLAIANPIINNRYIGEGSAAFARLSVVRAKVLLATTPNIGTEGYPMPVPPHINCLAHVFHGVGGLDTYEKYSLDNYNAILLASNVFEDSVRKLEELRNLEAKECFSVGIPYLDVLFQRKEQLKKEINSFTTDTKNAVKTVLLAPSWGEKGCLKLCKDSIIPKLLEASYKVILRPHPQSLIVENNLLENIKDEHKKNKNFSLDLEIDSNLSMYKADLLISDKSGIRFDFAFLYEKPIITINIEVVKGNNYEANDLGFAWEDFATNKIGVLLEPNEVENILGFIDGAMNFKVSDIIEFRNSCLNNFGQAAPVIANWLIEKSKTF